jgi:hypothetical protein
MAATTIKGRLDVPLREIERPAGPRRLMIALVVVALLFVGVASLYMVRMPGSLSSMLASIF